ncbi:hypothetical protein ACF0H5_022746 [Mactra antiquata]
MIYKWLLLGVVAALALQWSLTEVHADSQLTDEELALLRDVTALENEDKADLEARDLEDDYCDWDCFCELFPYLCEICTPLCEDEDEDDQGDCMEQCIEYETSVDKRMLEAVEAQERSLENSIDDENKARKKFFAGRFRIRIPRIPIPRIPIPRIPIPRIPTPRFPIPRIPIPRIPIPRIPSPRIPLPRFRFLRFRFFGKK